MEQLLDHWRCYYNRKNGGGYLMSELAEKQCVPCKGGVSPLTGSELAPLAAEIPTWVVIEGHHLDRNYTFDNFRKALDFTNQVGELAEEQGHHPDIYLTWGRVGVKLWTHKIDGLTESDFVMAAKIEKLFEK